MTRIKILNSIRKPVSFVLIGLMLCANTATILAVEPEDSSEEVYMEDGTEASSEEVYAEDGMEVEDSESEYSDVEYTDIEYSDIENLDIENSDIENSDIENSDIENSNIENSDTEDSEIYNSDDEAVGAITNVDVNLVYRQANNTVIESVASICTETLGTNANQNDYSAGRWDYAASVIESYIVPLANGIYMRFQYESTGYLVQYFDSEFNFLSQRTIPIELPTFGGFYSDGSSYYILSGQFNGTCDDSVEVYRLTKYTKDWVRYDTTASLYGANTETPFRAGSARFVNDGSQLIIRTCHRMYNGHQASVMIKVNTDSMAVVGSMHIVYCIALGYVSHSFNQFICLDDGYMVALDHGDAYERGLCLIQYKNKYSAGKLDNAAIGYNILPFAGGHGENRTGCAVGGFVATSSNYLVAYAITDHSNYGNSTTRNIGITSVDKNELKPTAIDDFGVASYDSGVTHYTLTTYSEGETGARNPYLIQIERNSEILLWSVDDKVYYCMLNAKGAVTGATYYFDSKLSDCEPIVADNKVVWYTYNDDNLIFYSIDLTDIANTQTKIINFGHDYHYDEKGNAQVEKKCAKCGDASTLTAMESFGIYYNKDMGYSYYGWGGTTILQWDCTETIKVKASGTVPANADIKEITVETDNTQIVKDIRTEALYAYLTPGPEEGIASITLGAKYNSAVQYIKQVKLIHHYSTTGTRTDSKGTYEVETCSGCGSVREKLVESAEPSYMLFGMNALLKDKIGLNIKFGLMQVGWSIVVEGANSKVTYPVPANSNLSMDIEYDVVPKDMRNNIKLYVVNEEGEKISCAATANGDKEINFSLYSYLSAITKSSATSKNDRDIAEALIKYCDNAAYYFYGVNAPNGTLYSTYPNIEALSHYGTLVYTTINSKKCSLPQGVTYIGASLILNSTPLVRYYFAGNLDGCRLTINNVECSIKHCVGDIYYIEDAEGILLSKLGNYETVVLTKESTGDVWGMGYCPLTYCNSATVNRDDKLSNLCKSLYNLYINL